MNKNNPGSLLAAFCFYKETEAERRRILYDPRGAEGAQKKTEKHKVERERESKRWREKNRTRERPSF